MTLKENEKKRLLKSLGLVNDIPPSKRPRLRHKVGVNIIAAEIAKERVRLGYTQKDLAAHAGVGFDTVRRVEQGELSVSLEILLKLLNFLNLSIGVIPRP